jgi:dTDP-4-amino-4,6-dideoxygalactose transaminase
MNVKQADPGAMYRALKSEIDAAVARVLASGWYVLGQEGEAFEREFAGWLGVPRTVGCGSGTDAIALTLRGLDIGAGSTVVTVSHTAVATVAAIEMVGAVPLLIDIDPLHYTMDPAELVEVLDHPPQNLPPIRAVMPVHLYGQAADMAAILAACAQHGVAVIEDCSQSHGATLDGRKLGTFGDAAVFSLYPTKNLGALGDAGVVATRDAALADHIAALRQYGWRSRYVSDEVGVNSRLDEMQAAILRALLPHLDTRNARRAAIAAIYDAAIGSGGMSTPSRRPAAGHVFHQYVIRTANREGVRSQLAAAGIGTAIHYPMAVHVQPAYRGRIALGPSGCVESEIVSAQVLSLPIFPELTDAEIAFVANMMRDIGKGSMISCVA